MEYEYVIKELIEFRNQKGWQKYHTLPALARALSIETAEVNQLFLWQDSETVNAVLDDSEQSQKLKMELADTLTYAYYMCEKLGVEPNDLVHEKLQTNKGRHWKFDED